MVSTKGKWVTGIGLFYFVCAAQAEIPNPADPVDIRITAPTMVAALIQFSQQTGLQLVIPTNSAGDIAAPAISGTLTPRAALNELLRDSGLTYTFVNERTISVSLSKARSANGTLTTTVKPR